MACVCKQPPTHLPNFLHHSSQLSPRTALVRCGYRKKRSGSAATRSLIIEAVEGEAVEETRSVTRRLILLRHAESSWEDRSLRDHDRPLSIAGRLAAISVSRKLQRINWVPELILSSDAARTRETLKMMQEHVRRFSEAEVHFMSSFYSVAAMDGQTAEHLQKAICKFSRNNILTVMCMGHNRGWEEAASMFSGASIELKTSNAALLEASGRTWEEAFTSAGLGGWKLTGIVKPDDR
ncbi:unnamed protein product [Victoria cruziana]